MVWHKLPYTNFHDLNEDWITSKLFELDKSTEEAQASAEASQASANASQASAESAQISAEASHASANASQASAESSNDALNSINSAVREMQNTNTRIDNLIFNQQTTQGNTELVDARNSYDGMTYNSVGLNIRAGSTLIRTGCMTIDTINYDDPIRLLFENGDVALSVKGWTYNNTYYKYRVRTPENYIIRAHVGDVITSKDWSNVELFVGFKTLSGSFKNTNGWKSEDVVINEECYVGILIRRKDGTTFEDPRVIADLINIIPFKKSTRLYDLIDYDEIEYGLLSAVDGTINITGNMNNRDITSEYIEVNPNYKYTIKITQTLNNQSYYFNWVFYDGNKNFISGSSKYGTVTGYVDMEQSITAPSNAKYIRVCMRTRTDGIIQLFEGMAINYVKPKWYYDNINIDSTASDNIKSIAHAGNGNNRAPENTLIAYIESYKQGYKYVECDIRFTSDNIPVLLHDATIDRTSNGSGNVADMTFEQLQQYDFGSWAGEEYAGTKIPSLKEFLLTCKKYGLHPYIETHNIKPYQAEIINNIVDECGYCLNLSFISFDMRDLFYLRKVNKVYRLGYIIDDNDFANWDDVVNKISILKNSVNNIFIDARSHLVDRDNQYYMGDRSILGKYNIPLELWLIQNPNNYNSHTRYNVDDVTGFTSNTITYKQYQDSKL